MHMYTFNTFTHTHTHVHICTPGHQHNTKNTRTFTHTHRHLPINTAHGSIARQRNFESDALAVLRLDDHLHLSSKVLEGLNDGEGLQHASSSSLAREPASLFDALLPQPLVIDEGFD
jgi:hypothetical protein